jgi:hypothetical protein
MQELYQYLQELYNIPTRHAIGHAVIGYVVGSTAFILLRKLFWGDLIPDYDDPQCIYVDTSVPTEEIEHKPEEDMDLDKTLEGLADENDIREVTILQKELNYLVALLQEHITEGDIGPLEDEVALYHKLKRRTSYMFKFVPQA